MPPKNGSQKIHAVDVFCGIGGLTHGLNLSGIRVKAGFDTDPACQYAYEANNRNSKFFLDDVRDLQFRHIAPHYKDADVTVMVGCAPCQPFSAHNENRKTKTSRADDCSLVGEFARLIEECNPDLVSMENVPGLMKHESFDEFLSTLDQLRYCHDHAILRCVDYGVPQNRRRLVLLASKLGDVSLPRPMKNKMTVADFIRDLPEIQDGESSPDDPAHISMALSQKNKQRIRQSKQGGTWKDWDDDIVNACHRKASYSSSYGRMRWDAPAPTITTQFCYYSTGRFGHPEQHRAISVREAALLQTFPRDYKFAEAEQSVAITKTARHVGNAVPVKLAEAIGKSLIEATNV